MVIPLEARSRPNPLAAAPAAAKEGLALYQQSCAVCHGSDGRSDTPIGRGLYPPALDLTSPHVKRWSDAELFWIIRNGIRLTGMPAWNGQLSDDQTWKTVLAVRELQKATPAPPPPATARLSAGELAKEGSLLFRQENCIGCHGLRGEGGTIGPDLSDEGRRGRTDAWMIGHLLDPSAYAPGSIMPPARNLSEQQIRALTAFLRAQK
ncbi:MAG TPA: c-type cytochrome [Bryobacterales bacterium]|nr:c-type cytochrome [Bryobacterales bacterium]